MAAGVTELLSGTGAVLGAVTPLASAMTTGTMTVAVAQGARSQRAVDHEGRLRVQRHAPRRRVRAGRRRPGRAAIDGRLLRRRAGLGWAVGQLALGAGCAAAVMWNAGRARCRRVMTR